MNIAVLGLWHLGSVFSACLAGAGHSVTGWDPDPATVDALASGRPLVAEPGLPELVQAGLDAGRLRMERSLPAAVADADIVWIAFDTPVDDDDRADVDYVVEQATRALPHLKDGALVVVSSQLPVGSVARLERALAALDGAPRVSFAYRPENLRLGKAIYAFTHPERIVAGVRSPADRQRIAEVFAPICDNIEWMSVESAEMTKHAINAFLATSVTFINELAVLCEHTGADASEVERGLKTEKRIGPYAYLSPGAAFAGGTLARDVVYLRAIGKRIGRPTPLFDGVQASNTMHRGWARERLRTVLGPLAGKTVAIWGLTYKPGTDTLRRSMAVELCQWLIDQGATVRVHDPAVSVLPDSLARVARTSTPLEAAAGADALVVGTEWPAYRAIEADALAAAMPGGLVLDANGFLPLASTSGEGLRVLTVGRRDDAQVPGQTGGGAARRREITEQQVLSGRAAIVTGASRGLGLAIAKAYARAGANIMLCARDEGALAEARREIAALARPGQRVESRVADVTNEQDVQALVEAALAVFGRLHVLVNNAGVYGPMGPIETVGWTEWQRAMDININGSVLPIRAVLPHFKAHRYGKIVQLSGGGATNPLPRITAYAASKAGVVRLAECVALDVAEFGIDVNAVAPGALNTRMMDELLAAGPGTVGEELFARMKKVADEGGTPLEVGAELAVFLGSAESDGITGRLISAVWDPWRDLPARKQELDGSDIYTIRRIVPGDRGKTWGDQ